MAALPKDSMVDSEVDPSEKDFTVVSKVVAVSLEVDLSEEDFTRAASAVSMVAVSTAEWVTREGRCCGSFVIGVGSYQLS